MRRAFSISLIFILWLGPFAAFLPAADDARLPLCCRRGGAHHCMGQNMDSASTDASPVLRAPSHCPAFPDSSPAHIGSTFATLATPALQSAPALSSAIPVVSRARAFDAWFRTPTDRGPPPALLA